ncbi:acyl-CoA/acyl-ACP dehydrogenase [Gluconobacter cerinus]|uniref:acyl-CoA/acyl-ACP dehydrogenase n=1 Tax=Gluconobacter cerinus TaxID=38307 RepID=UPI001B8C6A37|nr:acyl-CoA/acyl-ACP dehydrogenase [Gluconobacter cerinus]MBS1072697.1 acyl-CoA/acyl-ACP dehydrogenase [Gluconobacter cerinus]
MSVADQSAYVEGLALFRARVKHLFEEWKAKPFSAPENQFPVELLNALRAMGAFDALFSVEDNGLGLCQTSEGGQVLLTLLRRIGYLSLSLGRGLEGHVNVVRLVELYGTRFQRHALKLQLENGNLAGIWVTDGSSPVSIQREGPSYRLSGIKGFASGVRQVSVALITAIPEHGEALMVLAPTTDLERQRPGPEALTGMQASGTGAYDFTGLQISSDDIIGSSGDYLRQPEFSAGAWRGSAVALGGMDHLIDLLRQELLERERAGSPHQLARIGEALILQKTAAMWVHEAAQAAYSAHMKLEDVTSIINLARLAVEKAALDLITLVQRSLGLSAFIKGKAVEQVMRDLATYLRQPAPDEALTEAAAWFVHHDWPEAGP